MNSFHDSVKEKMPARDQARHGERQRDPPQDLQPRRAVDQRAFLELVGDRLEVADQQPRAERHQEGRIDQDQRERRVEQAELEHHRRRAE